jgi:hypothetical protein
MVLDRTLLDQIGPELPGDIELCIHVQRLREVHGSVVSDGRVVHLAVRGVAGSGVVPGAGALQGRTFERLKHFEAHLRIQLPQEDTECGAHDPCADKNDVRLRDCSVLHGSLLK